MMRRFLLTSTVMTLLVGGLAMPTMATASDGTDLLSTLGGAALGGFIGNQFGHGDWRTAATGIGAFTGALVGHGFAQSLDRPSGYYGGGYGGSYYGGYGYGTYYAPDGYYEPNYVAPPSPIPPRVVYVEPDAVEYRQREPAYVEGGYVGNDAEPYCREFTQQVRIGNEVHESFGTACLQPDGSWRVVR